MTRTRRTRDAKPGYIVARDTASASRRSERGAAPTGLFGAHRPPKVVGISEDVAFATRQLARSARRAEKAWLRTLPKGVTV